MSCCSTSNNSNKACANKNSNGISTLESSTTPTPPSTTISTPQRTFYRRPLPSSCTGLSSPEGQSRFASALTTAGLKSFFVLMEQFTTQSEPAFCGITTLVIVLNALAMDPRKSWKGPWRWYEESMLNCCLELEQVKKTGITMNSFSCLALCQGLRVTTVYADDEEKDDDEAGFNRFREAVRKACVVATSSTEEQETKVSQHQPDNTYNNPQELLVVSYSRKVLGQTGSGHFSPIAAYDSVSDSVLVLDTARFKYGAHWVPVPLLFEAMKPVDPDSNRSRGYMLLRQHDDPNIDDESPSLIPSILFRSQRKQNPVRRQYKEFLTSTTTAGEITLDQVIQFWTLDATKPSFIWTMMEPQLTPVMEGRSSNNGDEDEDPAAKQLQLVHTVRQLIHKLLLTVSHGPFPAACCECRVNYSRTLQISPQEAIFIVYLASLDEGRRKEIVRLASSSDDNDDDDTAPEKAQLLVEADLLRCAIDMSDETF